MPWFERLRLAWSAPRVANSSTQALASRTARGAFTVTRSANFRAALRTFSRPGSTTSFTRPSSRARAQGMGSPVRISSMATAWGIFMGSRKRPPAAGMSERLTSGTPKTAFVDATTRSHASTISQPPARAMPSTAAIRGFVRGKPTRPAKPPFLVTMFSRLDTALRSAPAQKTFGCVLSMMPIHRSSSASKASRWASIWADTAPLTAFIALGLSMEKIATWPRFSNFTASSAIPWEAWAPTCSNKQFA
mmetsp:Transcript_106898/g.312536  ORF Transcript_106898/g.312536 Transcript_106898/m.312536 type:complete len:248 (-) Transcript_106898:16-759(-)